ncbi:MAG: Flp pilus assembly protein CpaB [Sneathiella sp.]|nr:Flp pilus assembly protein CpaB [Sneathiella sp.]
MRSLIFIMLCAIFLGSAAYLGNMYLFGQKVSAAPGVQSAVPISPVYALRLSRDAEAGEMLGNDMIEWRRLEAGNRDRRYLLESELKLADLSGAVLTTSLAGGTFLEAQHILRPKDAGYLAALVGKGMRAKPVRVSNLSDFGVLRPGDHVDVILTYTTPAPAGKGMEVAVKTLLGNIRILAVGEEKAAPEPRPTSAGKAGTNLTLALLAKDVEIIAVAEKVGSLSIALRALNDPDDGNMAELFPSILRESDVIPDRKSQGGTVFAKAASRDIRIMRGGDISVMTLSQESLNPGSVVQK